MSATLPRSYIYGDCDPGPDSGCAPPLEVQHHASCARNPLSLDVPPRRVHRVRGHAIAAEYGSMIDVGVGRHTVTVFARGLAKARRAVRRLRRRGEADASRPLPAPVYPRPVLREVERLRVAYAGSGPWLPWRMARLLGPEALAGIEPPKRTWRVVARERQIALNAYALGRRRTLERYGLEPAELRRIERRVRGLSGRC